MSFEEFKAYVTNSGVNFAGLSDDKKGEWRERFDRSRGGARLAAPASPPPSASGAWACPKCTFENAKTAQQCEMCDQARPAAAVAAAATPSPSRSRGVTPARVPSSIERRTLPAPAAVIPSGPKWKCPLCTFENEMKAARCDACDAAKGTKAPERKPTKIVVSVASMVLFLRHLMSQEDRCSVTAFNHDYHPLINLGPEALAIAALLAIKDKCEGGTKLWNAVGKSVIQFLATADRTRPWILIILTDGDDSGSELGISKTAELLTAFNKPDSNFTFIIGLGEDVKEASLRKLCQDTGSKYLPAEDSSMLEKYFALIAIQVATGVQIDITRVQTEGGAQAHFARVSEQRKLRRQAIDILMLCDISGSMNLE